jgi:hypothetical protein
MATTMVVASAHYTRLLMQNTSPKDTVSIDVTLKVLLDLPSPKDTEVEIGLGLRTCTFLYM